MTFVLLEASITRTTLEVIAKLQTVSDSRDRKAAILQGPQQDRPTQPK